jgi:hypothetical protein
VLRPDGARAADGAGRSQLLDDRRGGRRRRRATPARRRPRPGRRADPGHRSGATAAPARHRHPATPARPGPPAALVGLATSPPAPLPPSPSTLERLRRDDTMITTNYSCRIRQRTAHGSAAPHRPGGQGANPGTQFEETRWTRARAVTSTAPCPALARFEPCRPSSANSGPMSTARPREGANASLPQKWRGRS